MVFFSLITNLLYNYFFLAQKCSDDQMTVVQEIAMTGHGNHQYQAVSDSIEGVESDRTMEDLEYQVDSNNIVNKINVHVVAQQSHEMTELSTSNTRKRLRKDNEIPNEDLKPKKERLDLEASSDSNGICKLVDIYLLNFTSSARFYGQ